MKAKRKNLFGFSPRSDRQRTAASSRSFSSLPGSESHARKAGSRAKASTFQGFSIQRTASGGYVVPKIDRESEFEDLTQAKRFIRAFKKNPKRNPAEAAAEAYEEFHGTPSQEVVTVKKTIFYHGHLAAIGDMRAIHGISRDGNKWHLKNFGKAILCENEARTQLFIEGGNQKVEGIKRWGNSDHEMQDMGVATIVEYFTTKTHLGKDGGTAIYVHKFGKTPPRMIYDVRNEQLMFAGGGYDMPPEGIDN
jgi:hypothetical protein